MEERVKFIVGRLNFYKRNRTYFSSLTSLAHCIASDLSVHEGRTSEAGCKPIDHSTLMRRNGKYYSLLRSHLSEQSLEMGDSEIPGLDSIAKRHIQLRDIELLQLRREVKRLQDKLCNYVSCAVPEVSGVPYKYNYPEGGDCVSGDVGRVAKLFFDMLLDTEQFKFDTEAGDLLHVGRARRIALSSRDMACFLNWLNGNPEYRN
ncbi:hypothetical protein LNN38_25430 [Pseudomonas sp. LA21]|uniref:hypothetical protein n=1 Tax=Pseudomonas sp. LA21 TaxID=2893373 RepID=UPI001FB8437D|nr:hypothetical protein [Pseudomonas sp. LA21]MCJ1888220.1 hypothetical protein [Pseudomonas sp. LA21]